MRLSPLVWLGLAACTAPANKSATAEADPSPSEPGLHEDSADTGHLDDSDGTLPVVRGPSEGPFVELTAPTPLGQWEATGAALVVEGRISEPDGAWTAFSQSVALDEGLQLVSVRATNSAGETGSATLEVLWQPGAFFGETVSLGGQVFSPGDTITPLWSGISGAELVVDCGTGEQRGPMEDFAAPALDSVCEVWAEVDGHRTLPSSFVVWPALDEAHLANLVDLADTVSVGATDPEALAMQLAALPELRAIGWTEASVWWQSDEGAVFEKHFAEPPLPVPDDLALPDEAVAALPSSGVAGPPPPPSSVDPSPTPDFHLYMPFYGDRIGMLVDKEVGRIATSGQCPTPTKQEYIRDETTVARLKEMGAGVHIFATHSGSAMSGICLAEDERAGRGVAEWVRCGRGLTTVAVLTGQTLDDLEADLYQDLVNQRVSLQDFFDDGDDTFYAAVHPAFFADTFEHDQLADSVVMFSSCDVGRDAIMHRSLVQAGAVATYSYDDFVAAGYAELAAGLTLRLWGSMGRSLGEAVDEATSTIGKTDDEWVVSHGHPAPEPASPALPLLEGYAGPLFSETDLQDGGFEDGAAAWTVSSPAEVVPSLLHIRPTQGTRMLDLAADPDGGASYSSASQPIGGAALPAGDYVLTFQRRILTSDDNHWTTGCDGHENPWFVARLDAPSGNRILFEEDPSTFCEELREEASGWFYESDWRELSVPFSVPADVPDARITFQVGTSYRAVHHTLVDDVRLEGTCAE